MGKGKTLRFQSKRTSHIPPYMFAELNVKKARLKETGMDLIDLGIGEPGFSPPPHIIERLGEEIRKSENSMYPSYIGCREFREAVSRYYKERYDVELDPDTEVIALIGSKEGVANLILSQLDPGDLALVPDPCYPVYRMATLLADGECYSLPLKPENAFLPDYPEIEESVRERARLLVVNYPNNPTTATADRGFYERTVAFAKRHKTIVVHDFAYNEISFNGYEPVSILQVEGAKDIAVELGSLSKTFCIPGWRIGYAVGNRDAIHALKTVKSNTDSGQYSAVQRTAAYALNGPRAFLEENLKIYRKRQQVVVSGLREIGMEVAEPRATFFVWAPLPEEHSNSARFAEKVLEDTGVVVAPGAAFGSCGEGYIRLSLSAPTERLQEAIARMRTSLKR
ncbi:MAG: LL-diaminopimelate aminotransferase [Novibacillus thermophilus]